MLILLSVYLYKFHLKARMGKVYPLLKRTASVLGLRLPVLKPAIVSASSI